MILFGENIDISSSRNASPLHNSKVKDMLKPRLGYGVTFHPNEEGTENAPYLLEKGAAALKNLGCESVCATEFIQDARTASTAAEIFREGDIDVLCLLQCSWTSDDIIVDMLDEIDVPIITWAVPGINTGSLCSCQQLNSVLKDLNKPYKFVYGNVEDAKAHRKIGRYAFATALKKRLRKARLGLIGYRTGGMTEVTFDEHELKSLFGPRVIHLGIDELKDSASQMSDEEAQNTWDSVKKSVGAVKSGEEEGIWSTKVYLALKDFVKENNLSGFTVECYPKLMGQVCLAHSLLSEEGIVAACEGDVNSALATLMLYWLTGEPVHNTDLLAVYEDDNSAVLSHCGSGGFSLAKNPSDITLDSVRLAGEGICVLFPAKPGPVTMVNIVGRRGTYRLSIIEGEAVKTEMAFAGNPIRVRFPLPIDDVLELIAEEGVGHHWMIGYGHVKETLVEFCKLAGVKCIVGNP